MKKLTVLLLAILSLCIAAMLFSGCGNDTDNSSDSGEHKHSYVQTVVEPTCTEVGYTENKCSCGESYRDKEVAVIPHTNVFVAAKEATCTEEGNTAYYECSVCHKYFSDENGKTEIADKNSVVTGKVEHQYSDGMCVFCETVLPTPESYFTFTLLENGTYEVTAEDKDIMLSAIIIPATYNGKAVTSIGLQAFYKCTILKKVIIESGITSIDSFAFQGCSKLTSIVIPDSVTSIGSWAFYACNKLANITISPDHVTSIEYAALDYTAYYRDDNNWENGVLYFCKHLIKAKETLSGDYQIKEGTLTIVGPAFSSCSKLTSIVIPDSMTSIGGDAFYGCTGLTSITIPSSVTDIGKKAFYHCSGLTSINVDESNKNYKSIDGNLYSKDGKMLIQYAIGKTESSFTVPSGVTTIYPWSFELCGRLTSIILPKSVVIIDHQSFYHSGLKSVYYKGTEAEWSAMRIGSGNYELTNATKYYYSVTAPTESGNYWHYGSDGNIVVW